ncbi:MAG: hypothetical protein AAF937_03070 [Planctomycetota bacterium]
MMILADLESAIADEMDSIIVGGLIVLGIAVVWVSGTLKKVSITKQRERTKRELAAYVAEGSMSPEDAKAILSVGENEDVRELVLKRAADGWITPKKAEQMLAAMDKQSAASST